MKTAMHPVRQTDEKARDLIAQEAALWHARITTGTVDRAAFERWRDQSPLHAVAMARIVSAWETLAAVPLAEKSRHAVGRRRFLRVAGGATVAGLAAAFVADRAAAWPSAQTAVGERRLVVLGAGARAMLNTDSALAWHSGEAGWRIRLERGEVALQLDDGRPVRLETAAAVSILSAGRFDARLDGVRLEVAVLRGRAGLPATMVRTPQVTAHSGQALLITPSDHRAVAAADRIDRAVAWQSGEILFRDEPLATAIADYNRYLSRKIVIADPAIGAIRVGGRFTTTDPQPFLHGLRDGLGIAVDTDANGFSLRRA
ncbi:FecR family protein [Sphingomonas abietis]|uniref:DUF4880 domain-containing protein n=1 Tax=Sphingomonas abietis TaxID=3012344 RepID=A0ABY7NQT1_9SPHN|nr:FecR domain-containing protein [Sphingomonas abietis]WBO22912.1 DUF4880 domain-containing protein [Sphingomonas abietis]